MIVCVDPGKRIGYAVLNGVYVDITAVGTVGNMGDLPRGAVCVIEMPRVYPNPMKWKGDPQHIVRLAFLAGRIVARYAAHFAVEPRTWRGMGSESAVWNRAVARLRLCESWILETRLSEHSRDAIGIALYVRNSH